MFITTVWTERASHRVLPPCIARAITASRTAIIAEQPSKRSTASTAGSSTPSTIPGRSPAPIVNATSPPMTLKAIISPVLMKTAASTRNWLTAVCWSTQPSPTSLPTGVSMTATAGSPAIRIPAVWQTSITTLLTITICALFPEARRPMVCSAAWRLWQMPISIPARISTARQVQFCSVVWHRSIPSMI